MSIFTNVAEFGGVFMSELKEKFRTADRVIIATGYFSHQTLESYSNDIECVVSRGGSVDIVVGMPFFEGISTSGAQALHNVHRQIRSLRDDGGGIRVVHRRPYHGKIYYFEDGSSRIIYIGSANFSPSGLQNNVEAMVRVIDRESVHQLTRFLSWLLQDEQSAYVENVESLIITDSDEYKSEIEEVTMDHEAVTQYDPSSIPSLDALPYLDLSLARVDQQPKSSLNVYFSKGRWSRITDTILPRPWFEVEVVIDKATTEHPIYPHGDFRVFTDDGFSFMCRTQGDNRKNFRSKDDLTILGKWIKGRLQKSGALKPLTPVTGETLARYGNDRIRLHRINEKEYFMEFKPGGQYA